MVLQHDRSLGWSCHRNSAHRGSGQLIAMVAYGEFGGHLDVIWNMEVISTAPHLPAMIVDLILM